jgi:hypothetical protein
MMALSALEQTCTFAPISNVHQAGEQGARLLTFALREKANVRGAHVLLFSKRAKSGQTGTE